MIFIVNYIVYLDIGHKQGVYPFGPSSTTFDGSSECLLTGERLDDAGLLALVALNTVRMSLDAAMVDDLFAAVFTDPLELTVSWLFMISH